ncbi:MAG: nucleotidyltransferase family protein [Candidatus Omnitrophota bacterium]
MGKRKHIKAIILAAGYATRLYPLTLNIPKPLLKITRSKTVVDFIVDDLQASGLVEEAIIVTNNKFYGDFSRWSKTRSQARSKKILVSVLNDGTTSNEDRLGAIGDIYFAVKKKKISGDTIVIGGDNLFDKGFAGFLKFAAGKKPFASLGLFDIRDKKEATRFGVVSVDSVSRVSSFEEKPLKPKSALVATCLYYFPQPKLAFLEKYILDPKTSKDAPGNYIRWLLEQDRVYGFTLSKGHWHDIGHFDSYKEAVAQFNR